jgi:transposase-like protein
MPADLGSSAAQSEGFVTATGAGEGGDPADSAPAPDGLHRKPRLIDAVLDLYGGTDFTAAELAAATGCAESSVSVFLSQARKASDRRVMRGDERRRFKPQRVHTPNAVKERAVDLYAETLFTQREIAGQLGCPKSTVGDAISMARRSRDKRVLKGDMARQAAAGQIRVSCTQFGPRQQPEPPSPVAVPPPAPVHNPPPPDKVLVADEANAVVYGPKDAVTLSRPVVRTLGRLATGGAFPVKQLLAVGPWAHTERLHEALTAAVPKLEAAGIELMKVGKEMYRVRPLEAAE